ncbi:uncharacterized protein LOC143890562 [Tasmannia lanceolata]|uniref:uncharacterized protein LOC143890562 n=1 Tax=Tasmannia lanceolata TaxID=3420 RepID=UPI004063992D
MDFANSVNGIEKLNNSNYLYWKSCIESYLQWQDLWEIVNGAETTSPNGVGENAEVLRKWKIKAGKAMFVLRATIQRDFLDYIRDAKTLKEAWDVFATFFSKTNDTRVQMLENEIGSVSQGNKTIPEYFMKVNKICHEITQLDEESRISVTRMRRMIIRGLKPEYSGFITAIQ